MKQHSWRDFLRMKSFLLPYAWRLGLMIRIGLSGSGLWLAESCLSQYLGDNALMRRDLYACLCRLVDVRSIDCCWTCA